MNANQGRDGGGHGRTIAVVCAIIILLLVVVAVIVCGWDGIGDLVHPPTPGPGVNLGMGV